jgi:hypothetical protein
MADQPTNQRPWSTVDDEELRHLRAIASFVMALQIGQGDVVNVPPILLRVGLNEAVECYATLLANGTIPDSVSDLGSYITRVAERDNASRDEPPSFQGSVEEFQELLNRLDDEKLS